MSDQHRRKRLFHLHAVIGFVGGLVIYAALFSGVPALFAHDLQRWEDPRQRTPPADAPSIEALVQAVQARDGALPKYVYAGLPHHDTTHPSISVPEREHGPHRPHRLRDGALETSEVGLLTFHRRLHTNLRAPGPLGRWALGLAGLAMLSLLVTGLLVDRRRFADAFVLQRGKSLRSRLSELHKRVGLWTLPFTLLMSFTGALLGLLQLVLTVGALVAFSGDTEAAAAAVLGTPTTPAESPAAMQDLDTLAQRAETTLGRAPAGLVLEHYGDANAVARFTVPTEGSLIDRSTVTYALATGEQLELKTPADQPAGAWITQALFSLHYANYAGVAVRVLYAVLGLLSAALAGLGLWVAVERAPRMRRGQRRARRMWTWAAAIVFGFPLGTAATFALHALSPSIGTASNHGWLFLACLLGTAAVAWRNPKRAAASTMWATAGLLCLSGTADLLLRDATTNTALVDTALFAFGLCIGLATYTARSLPSSAAPD